MSNPGAPHHAYQEQMPRILESNLAPVTEVTTEYKSNQQLPPLQNVKGKGSLRARFQVDPSSEQFSNNLQPNASNAVSHHGSPEPTPQPNMINSQAHGFQIPHGMTKVPLYFSGSIPSL